MTLTDRDKKIVLVLAPLLLVGAFIFLVMKPKREEAVKAAQALEEQRDRRDAALERERQLRLAKASFASDYQTVVRLGKAVPTDVDMPSVLVQLERAAKGTGIEFGRISAGPRVAAAGGVTGGSSTAAPGGSAGSAGAGASGSTASGGTGSASAPPAAAGGAQAQSGSGQAVEQANNGAATASQASAGSASASPDTATSSSTGQGGLPVGGGSAAATGAGGGTAPVAGLDSVPLDLRFTGSFFSLADFFHRLKRFVHVANEDLVVRGRLMTIDSFGFKSGTSFPELEAEIKARIYLAPQQQGAAAGASPSAPATGGTPSASTASSAPPATSPTAAAPSVATP